MLKQATRSYRAIQVFASEEGFGAEIVGVDLSRPLSPEAREEIRAAWARHSVVSFPDQPLSLDELEAFTLQMGKFGVDPSSPPCPATPTSWSCGASRREGHQFRRRLAFRLELPAPAARRHPAALQGHAAGGGDTLFADCASAYDALSPAMKTLLAPLQATHSAGRAYGTKGSSPARPRNGPWRSSSPRTPTRA
uniref:TauD/TfdA family dioxygenase n=1 Tax=Phenylobacterium glaciei TaxID=2803784 RepID=A0A974P6A6_9CAUL|nr:TauD/TfdA family dioxygenase [Phenylobacterium glaciei]